MTSGNISEEPIIIDRGESVEKLSGIADAFLDHDRDIFMRIDDSVLRVIRSPQKAGGACAATASFIRRSRGYAPEPIPLKDEGPDVLGCGADIKNTFAITRGKYVIISQHIGDMENYETVRFFEETLGNLTSVYRAVPGAIAYDLHPGYLSSRWAIEQGKQKGLKLFGIQHHYAHIGSVIAEHGLKGKVIGVAFDGTGYGEDGTLWGGEFLIADSVGYRRAGHLQQVALPGAAMAVKEPWRVALSCLREAFGNDVMDCLEPTGFIEKYGRDAISDILRIAGNRTFSPLSSGAGRFFDAASALMGICDTNTFEGEASIALESYAVDDIDDDYPVDIHFGDTLEVDFSHAFLCIMDDLRRKTDRHVMATKFHNTAATAIIRVVLKLSMMNNIKTVALSGGVFQNLFLFNRVFHGLQAEGLAVYANEKVPCNDAGISLGQAYIAREWIKAGKG
jgi:hydrogenase maturation protein HypF